MYAAAETQHRNQTKVSCIAGGFFTSLATREVPGKAEEDTKISEKGLSKGMENRVGGERKAGCNSTTKTI